ncbi:MAG: NAD(P)/FAD-dependent oxidoreductase [Gemmatimonadetes bacterium]|nr:NAD(P)/FAD-dependent oxidoreductase [Gemmatimonadota bacterium]
MASPYDVIIVGGGPAGLSAAVVLGRCRRRVLLIDDGEPRNARSPGVRGYLTRDDITPLELLRLGREEVERYGVEIRHDRAVSACMAGSAGDATPPLFEVVLSTGGSVRARKLLLATGVRDNLPEVDCITTWYGRGVYHCPYCDGYEHRDQPLATLGVTQWAAGLALALLTWSRDVTVLTQGDELPKETFDQLTSNGVKVVSTTVARLEGEPGDEGCLTGAVLEDGRVIPLGALFFSGGRTTPEEALISPFAAAPSCVSRL